jgi:hypothetical protein
VDNKNYIYRSTKHLIQGLSDSDNDILNCLYYDCLDQAKEYVNKYWSEKRLFIYQTSKLIPGDIIEHSQWRQLLYRYAETAIRKAKQHKQRKPILEDFTIMLNKNLYSSVVYEKGTKEYNEYITVKLPYFETDKKIARKLVIPIKYHRVDDKFKLWTRRKTLKISKRGKNFFLIITYSTLKKKINKNTISLTLNEFKELNYNVNESYKTLLISGNNQYIKHHLKPFFDKMNDYLDHQYEWGGRDRIEKRKIVKYKTQLVNEFINKIDFTNVQKIYLEPLKGVFFTDYRNQRGYKPDHKLEYFVYRSIKKALINRCEIEGILLLETPKYLINPSFNGIREISREEYDKSFNNYYNNKLNEKGINPKKNYFNFRKYLKFRKVYDRGFSKWGEDSLPTIPKDLKGCYIRMNKDYFNEDEIMNDVNLSFEEKCRLIESHYDKIKDDVKPIISVKKEKIQIITIVFCPEPVKTKEQIEYDEFERELEKAEIMSKQTMDKYYSDNRKKSYNNDEYYESNNDEDLDD